jgi:hypothetical protein
VFLAPVPEWLASKLCQRSTPKQVTDPSVWCGLIREGVAEGSRNKSVAALSGHLLRRYVDPELVTEICLMTNERFSPPLDDGEVVSIVNSICRRELARREAMR